MMKINPRIISSVFLVLIISVSAVYSLPAERNTTIVTEDSRVRSAVDSLLYQMRKLRNTEPESGIKLGYQALDLTGNSRNSKIKANVFDELGMLFRKVSNYNSALNMHLKALHIYEEVSDSMGIAFALTNIGIVLDRIGNYNAALDYFFRSLAIKESLNDEKQIAYTANQIGLSYYGAGKYDSALVFLRRTEEIDKSLNDVMGLAKLWNTYALIKMNKGDYSEAEKYLRKSAVVFESRDSFYGLSIVYLNLARLFLLKHEPNNVKKYLSKTKTILDETHFIEFEKDLEFLYHRYYKETGDYEASLTALESYINKREEIYNRSQLELIANAEKQYSFENNEKENQLLRHENQINELRITNQKYGLIFLFFVLLFIGTSVVVIFKKNRSIKKINNDLTEQRKKLMLSNDQLEDIIAKKTMFFKIISHDLKNPFNFLINSSSLLSSEYDKLSENDKKNLCASIEKVSRESYDLLRNLQEWVSIQSGILKLNHTELELKNLVQSAVSQVLELARKKNLIIDNRANNFNVYGDPQMMITVFRNLLFNAVKYSYTEGKIEICADEKDEGMVEICIRDEGTGIDKETAESLFVIKENISKYGTNNEKGTGLGLLICKEIVEENGGKIFFESEPGAGSKFCITMPKCK